MSYATPQEAINPSWVGSELYGQAQAIIIASWNPEPKRITPVSINPAAVATGAPTLIWQQKIAPLSISQLTFGSVLYALNLGAYKPSQFIHNAVWVDVDRYDNPSASIVATWASVTYLSQLGFDSLLFSQPFVVQQQMVLPVGWQSPKFGDSYALFDYQYPQPEWTLDANWSGASVCNQQSGAIDGLWTLPSESKILPLTGWLSGNVSSAVGVKNSRDFVRTEGFDNSTVSKTLSVKNLASQVRPLGINSQAIAAPTIFNSREILNLKGWQSSRIGGHSIVNRNQRIVVSGINSQAFGWQVTYNLRQYVYQQNRLDQSSYGKPYLQGGVRWLYPRALDSLAIGRHDALNTTASQELKPSGINSQAIGVLSVSPRILYPFGIDPRTLREPQVPQPIVYSPELKPSGIYDSAVGLQIVWHHTRPLAPKGIDSFDTGYPRVFDPTQFIQQIPFEQSTVFGDIALRNKSAFLKPLGIPENGVSPWAVIESKNRYYQIKGIESQRIGDAAIHNNTPSLFADGIDATIKAGTPAIGYWVREVKPTGFDHLALGRPLLTKTPELLPRGLDALSFGGATVWFKNRTLILDGRGIKGEAVGNPTVWFRYRYAVLQGWQSSRFANPVLTHGVREIIAHGFASERQSNNAWASHGTRQLAPKSIYTEFPSNHFVGRHQEIKPQGYEATLWGERIIPEIQAAYPQGFTGVFGLAAIGNFTRYVLPASFISVGNQPADRWGWQTVFNQTQYVSIEVTEDNGLVPPRWSEWQSIENRNKTVGAVGTLSQKFGYTKIDNNATPLLPKGIEPIPPSRTTMISHAVRTIKLEGIEPPPVNSWGVVHNAARVLGAKGFDAQALGADSGIVNTRRYYRNVGRIESEEFGTPMIADRIRTISIEPRHSIYPPYIQLPTVDLWTRYVSFNGYETAKYGLPSLSVHFNIIAPKWIHRDNFGWGALKNLTPELFAYGHDSQDFGQASIRTQWREVRAQGDKTELFGNATIADTKRYLAAFGFGNSKVSTFHEVTKTKAPPYTEQHIWLQNEADPSKDGFGIPVDKKFFAQQVGRPAMNQNVLYHQGQLSSKFGTAFLWSNNLVVESGIAIHNVSDGAVVQNKRREISLSDKGIRNEVALGKPRLSPHTIYAVKEAPQQAKANHPVSGLHYVGEVLGSKPAGEVFGRAIVESTIRSVRPRSFFSSEYRVAQPVVKNKTTVVSPDGFRRGRFGIPSIPFTPQGILIRLGIFSEDFGKHQLSRPPDLKQYIKPIGYQAAAFGASDVSNWIRHLSPTGANTLAMGRSKSGDTPFMWQGLRVGERVPMIIGGDDMLEFGTAFISHWVRDIPIQGFDDLKMDYTLSNFDERIKVKLADKKLPKAQSIDTQGIESLSTVGYQDLKYGQHFIRPDGNSDQFRKGGFA